jgi:hypothetical protein
MPLPDRAVLQEAAAQADLLTKWGKPVLDFDRVELKAWIWELRQRRLDNLTERLAPLIEDLEKAVRAIEGLGYTVRLTRIDDTLGASFEILLEQAEEP